MSKIKPALRDSVFGSILFAVAGVLFVLLSFLDGWAALVSGGIDVPTTPQYQHTIELVALCTWLPGLIAAVAGLVLWIVWAVKRKPFVGLALADFLVQLVLFVLAFVLFASIR